MQCGTLGYCAKENEGIALQLAWEESFFSNVREDLIILDSYSVTSFPIFAMLLLLWGLAIMRSFLYPRSMFAFGGFINLKEAITSTNGFGSEFFRELMGISMGDGEFMDLWLKYHNENSKHNSPYSSIIGQVTCLVILKDQYANKFPQIKS